MRDLSLYEIENKVLRMPWTLEEKLDFLDKHKNTKPEIVLKILERTHE